jgi:hypothetical protein
MQCSRSALRSPPLATLGPLLLLVPPRASTDMNNDAAICSRTAPVQTLHQNESLSSLTPRRTIYELSSDLMALVLQDLDTPSQLAAASTCRRMFADAELRVSWKYAPSKHKRVCHGSKKTIANETR